MAKRVFTVTKNLSGSNTYRKWSEYSEGDCVVGKFVGFHVCQYKKQNPKIQVVHADFADDSGETLIGKTLVINSCGSVDKAFENLSEGDGVQIIYTGKITMQKGPYAGKEAHTVTCDMVDLGSSEENDYDL